MDTVQLYLKAINNIVKRQKEIIGPIALEQVRQVPGVKVDPQGKISLTGDGREVLQKVVEQYTEFFGHASVMVCRDAVHEVSPPIPDQELPVALR